jgi:NADH-quinone oxidoreductase subunit A
VARSALLIEWFMIASCLPASPCAVGRSNKSGLFQNGFAGIPKWFRLPVFCGGGRGVRLNVAAQRRGEGYRVVYGSCQAANLLSWVRQNRLSCHPCCTKLKPLKSSNSLTKLRVERPQRGETPMTGILQNYLPLVVFIGIAAAIGAVLLIAPFIVAYQQPDPEKLSAYECGFNAFDDARMKFDVRFYLVAILFIIFDLEVAFLFPWAITFGKLGVTGFWSMMVFLGVLTVGFAYEWKKGALEWD